MVRRILENPTYAGHLTQGRVRTLSYKVRRRVALPKEEWAVVQDTHAPLVDQQTFDRVQAMLRVHSYRPAASAPHVLTGLAFCGDCGAPMAHVRDGSRSRTLPLAWKPCAKARRWKWYCIHGGKSINHIRYSVSS